MLSRRIGIRRCTSLPRSRRTGPKSLGYSCHRLPFASAGLGLDFVYFMCLYLSDVNSPLSSRTCPAHNQALKATASKPQIYANVSYPVSDEIHHYLRSACRGKNDGLVTNWPD